MYIYICNLALNMIPIVVCSRWGSTLVQGFKVMVQHSGFRFWDSGFRAIVEVVGYHLLTPVLTELDTSCLFETFSEARYIHTS